GDQLRIAVALSALAHKPPTQSFESYILDLQAFFPIACTSHRPCLSIAQPHPSDSEKPWRDRVLELEKQAEELRAQHEQEKL
ncbi:hypothetical protein BC628DRAFT_1300087, partial [Trametes gibbosa]